MLYVGDGRFPHDFMTRTNHQLKLENQRLCEKSQAQEEAPDARARDSQEQERRTQLEIDDENPDDDSAALVVSPFSSSDTDSFDALLPLEDERLCERSLVQEKALEFDLSPNASNIIMQPLPSIDAVLIIEMNV